MAVPFAKRLPGPRRSLALDPVTAAQEPVRLTCEAFTVWGLRCSNACGPGSRYCLAAHLASRPYGCLAEPPPSFGPPAALPAPAAGAVL